MEYNVLFRIDYIDEYFKVAPNDFKLMPLIFKRDVPKKNVVYKATFKINDITIVKEKFIMKDTSLFKEETKIYLNDELIDSFEDSFGEIFGITVKKVVNTRENVNSFIETTLRNTRHLDRLKTSYFNKHMEKVKKDLKFVNDENYEQVQNSNYNSSAIADSFFILIKEDKIFSVYQYQDKFLAIELSKDGNNQGSYSYLSGFNLVNDEFKDGIYSALTLKGFPTNDNFILDFISKSNIDFDLNIQNLFKV